MTDRCLASPSFAEATEDKSSPPPSQAGAVGYGSPPQATRFQPGRSGNPQGRPRRPRPAAPAPRAGRSELERALATEVTCEIGGRVRQVSVIRMVVARLTDKAMAGDVVACRELARLWCEADAARALRQAEAERIAAAEAAAEDLSSAASAKEEARRAAEQAEAATDFEASVEVADMAEAAARDAGEADMAPADRALKLLDAAEFEDGEPVRLKPWVIDAAAAHDPALVEDAEADEDGPLDLEAVDETLERLEIAAEDDLGCPALAAWFIDAARTRQGHPRLTLGDAALLALVRVEDGAPDWRARLAGLRETAGH